MTAGGIDLPQIDTLLVAAPVFVVSSIETRPSSDRKTHERMAELIYNRSVKRVAARKLIERITTKVLAGPE